MRGAMCVIVRDLIVYGVLTDMMRGRPAVYATFSSYDEVAHHSGLERADTLEALRKLDQQFGRIDRARRYAPRPYEIVVLSDHGQTQGATFKQRNGYGLDELVERSLEHGTVEKVAGGDEQHSMVGLAVGEATGRPDKQQGKRAKNDVSDREVVVLGSGNLGLISLMEEPRRLTLEEIDERHPRLIPALRAHPHVGWLLVRSSERGPVALGSAGAHYLAEGAVEGEDPLAPFAPNAPRHLLRTDGFAHVADIMVGSFYDPDLEEGCAFEELISFHGGIGGPQTRAFILHPVGFPLPDEPIVGAAQVHGVLSGWRQQLQGGERAGADAAAVSMNLVWSALVVVVAVALAVTAMLLVRRGAPEGSRFTDGDRASGVFGVLATGFSVLLGFVVFLAFESYDQSRAGAEEEALVLAQQVETAQFLGPAVAGELTGELVCYGRSVVHIEWPRTESGDQGDEINPWGVELFRTIRTVQPQTPSEEAAYGKWLDQTSDREAARIDRIHGAVGVIPIAAVGGAAPHLRAWSSSSCSSSPTAARARSRRRS